MLSKTAEGGEVSSTASRQKSTIADARWKLTTTEAPNHVAYVAAMANGWIAKSERAFTKSGDAFVAPIRIAIAITLPVPDLMV